MSPVDAHGGWPGVIGALMAGEDLSREAAHDVMATVLAGDATPAQIAATIVAFRAKGESVDELVGMVDAMQAAAAPLELPDGTIDIVGMGGAPSRRRAALNVSTIASIVAAAAGARVCKHGNRRASSTSGSFDLLEALGIPIELDGDAVARCVESIGVGFVFARSFHPAMRHAGPVRAELGVPTVFNVLGPLSHPGRVRRQVIGVADARLLDRVAGVLAARGTERAWVVAGADSLDELSTTGPSEVRVVAGDDVTSSWVDPTALGLRLATADELAGGDPARNAEIVHELVSGADHPARDIVVLNAAAGLVVADLAEDLPAGIDAAGAALADGRAAAVLAALVDFGG